MDVQRLTLLKRKLEALNYDGELDPKSAPLAEKVRPAAARNPAPPKKWQSKKFKPKAFPPFFPFKFRWTSVPLRARHHNPRPRERRRSARETWNVCCVHPPCR